MEVFVLMGSMDYEGDYLLGVYASEQEAVDALGVYNRDLTERDLYFIVRRVIGSAAHIDFDHRYL